MKALRWFVTTTTVAALFAAVPAASPTWTELAAQQVRPQQRGPAERTQLERRVMQQFAQLVQRELGLDSAATEGLFAAVDEFGEERRALQMREAALGRQLRGTGVYLSDEQSVAALEEFLSIKREEVRLLEAEQVRLSEVLTPPQVLRFYALREQLGERIRRLREQGPRGDAAVRFDDFIDLPGLP